MIMGRIRNRFEKAVPPEHRSDLEHDLTWGDICALIDRHKPHGLESSGLLGGTREWFCPECKCYFEWREYGGRGVE